MPYPFTFTVYDIVNLFGINVSMIVDMIRQCDVSNVVPVQRITHQPLPHLHDWDQVLALECPCDMRWRGGPCRAACEPHNCPFTR